MEGSKRKYLVFVSVVIAMLSLFGITSYASSLPYMVPDLLNLSRDSVLLAVPDSVLSVNVEVSRANTTEVRDVIFMFTDKGGLTLIEGSDTITDFVLDQTYRFQFYVPEDYASNRTYIKYSVSYKYDDENGVEKSAEKGFYSIVDLDTYSYDFTSDMKMSIGGMEYPSNIVRGMDASFKFNLINKNTYDFTNAEYTLYSDNTQLQSGYIGAVNAQSQTPVEFRHVFTKSGKQNLRLVIGYDDKNGNKADIQKNFTLTVTDYKPLEINSVIFEEETCELTFNIVNKNKVPFSNVQAYLYNKKGELTGNTYIGALQQETQIGGRIAAISDNVSGAYKLEIVYEDHFDKEQSVNETINLSDVIQGNEDNTEGIKIQSLLAPREQMVKSFADVKFSLTNPGETTIKGIEAFLYDENNKELDSIYISEIPPNTSSEFGLGFYASDIEGVASYRIKVKYYHNNKKAELSKSFSVNTVSELEEPVGSEKPANLKIQKIAIPNVIYSGTKTEIPVTIVNAGKGRAYNAELYVLNEKGEETAREYIGNIESSQGIPASFILCYMDLGEFKNTLYITYENADESKGQISKEFSSQVNEYRISISDMAGYEYLMVGNPSNIEFSVLNSGTVRLMNTTAYLNDAEGKSYGECYIGTIEPGVKKERQKFNKVMFDMAGQLEFVITLVYENEDMQQFTVLSSPFMSMVQEMYVPDMGMTPDMGMEGEMPTDGENVEQGLAPWIMWCIIGGGVLVVIITTIAIVAVRKKKKSKSDDDDDLDYFYEELRNRSVSRDNTEISENKQENK